MGGRRFVILASFLGVFALFFAVTATIPTSKQWLRDYFLANDRKILARADGILEGQIDPVAIIKVQTADSLSLEIYTKTANSEQLVFQKRLLLPEKRDGYFTFRGNSTNLVLSDVDGDGFVEILAPTFDDNLIPRLNIYKFDPSSLSFQRLGPDNFKL